MIGSCTLLEKAFVKEILGNVIASSFPYPHSGTLGRNSGTVSLEMVKTAGSRVITLDSNTGPLWDAVTLRVSHHSASVALSIK